MPHKTPLPFDFIQATFFFSLREREAKMSVRAWHDVKFPRGRFYN